MNYWLLLIPLLTALTGWLVIRLSLFLLFQPIKPKKILGLTWQGVLPRQQEKIAGEIGKFAATEFTSVNDLEQKVSDPQNFESIKPLIETHIDEFLRHKLKEQMPMIGMFIGDKTVQSLKIVFLQEIESLFPRVMLQFAGNIKSDLNIEQVIANRIAGLSPEKLNAAMRGKLSPQFRTASFLGAGIGLLIGIIQLIILLLLF